MYRNMINKILGGLMLVLVLCFTACEDEQLFGRDGNTTIRISATAKFSGAESRAVLATEYEATEDNVFMLYKGTDENATLEVMEAMASLEGTIENVLIEDGATYTAIMIANVPKSELVLQGVDVGSKLEALYSATYAVNTTDNKPADATAFTWSGVVCGITTANVRNGLNFELNPNVAKVTVNITNNSGGIGDDGEYETTKLVNVQVRNVVNKVRFAQNALSKASPSLFSSTDNKTGNISYINYEIEELDLSSSGASASFSWYVPHNECGTGTRPNPENGTAGVLPVDQTPTYVEIDGIRTIDFLDTGYKVYPGIKAGNEEYVNMTNFDVKADYQYTINADITNNGLTFNVVNNSDQVNGTEGQLVKLPSNANCYMIHPIGSMIKTGTSTVYELPIDRINEYWGATGGLAPDGAMDIEDNDTWIMEVIWQDINHQAIKFCQRDGSALTDTYTGKGLTPAYFKLMNTNTDAENQWYGNILVGVKKSGQSTYLWSWHLWITDYNPDAALPYSIAKNQSSAYYNFLYTEKPADDSGIKGQNVDLQGYWNYSGGEYKRTKYGNVQHWNHYYSRYWGTSASPSVSGAIWRTGLYADCWMMDRNLGSQSPNGMDNKIDPRDAYGMYYQYGRKDPFPFSNYNYKGVHSNLDRSLYKINGTTTVKWDFVTNGQQSVKTSVQNPTVFYGQSSEIDWCSESYNGNLWRSPVNVGDRGKSIFDPCPPGWCVPVYEAFDFMAYNPAGVYNSGTLYDTAGGGNYGYERPTLNAYIPLQRICNTYGYDKYRNSSILTLIVSGIPGKTGLAPFWAVFPMQGGVGQSGALEGLSHETSFMWTARAWSDGYRADGLSFRLDSGSTWSKSSNAYITQTVSGIGSPNSHTRNGTNYAIYNGRMCLDKYQRSRGHVVRCIQTPNKETLKFYNKK